MIDYLSIHDLLQQTKNNNNEITPSVITLCQTNLTKVYANLKKSIEQLQTENSVKDKIQKWVDKNQKKLKNFSDYDKNKSDQFLLQYIQVLMMGVWVAFDKKTPRHPQMISLWFNIHSKKNILQIKTGQGKTMIVAMTALYHALRGKKVDVFTSSSKLAQNETKSGSSVRKLFELFNISLGNNCCQSLDRGKVYKNQVIYGTSFQFQADYLKKIFCGSAQLFKDRNFNQNHVALLDEVDALLIDRMRDSTRISTPKPLFDSIKALFILIKEVKQQLLKAKSLFCGQIKVKILGEPIKIRINDDIQNLTADTLIDGDKKQIITIVKSALTSKLKYLFPNYLLKSEGYIMMMLKSWVDSIYQIEKYQKDVHYVIDQKLCQVIPVDISTGTYQKKTKWMNGIHQFLELKHGFDPSMDSIVTNYESNLIFFQRYQHYLYGMTGTISKSIKSKVSKSQKQQNTVNSDLIFENFLKKSYKVDIIKIPTAKTRLLKLENPKMFINDYEWLNGLINDAIKYSKNRIVLIIFQTIKQAKLFASKVQQKGTNRVINLYDHDDYLDTLQKKLDIQGTIIVSTNLGGRGTDIQIQNKIILDNGGLYVMMTYFAQNWRIQEQAFGRAGRNGQPGSGSFYLNLQKQIGAQNGYDNQTILQKQDLCQSLFELMCTQRSSNEIQRFKKAQVAIENQKVKKNLLDEFYSKYLKQKIQKLIIVEQKIEKAQRIIDKCKSQLIQSYQLRMEMAFAEQQWGIFLKRQLPDQGDNQKKIDIDFQKFVNEYTSNRNTNDVNPGIFAYYGQYIMAIDQWKAESYFQKALQKNKESWVNQYYTTYFKFKRQKGNTLSKNTVRYFNGLLTEICNMMIIQLSLDLVIFDGGKTPQKKKELQDLKVILTTQMINLSSIDQTLHKLVIQDNLDISITPSLSKNKSSCHSLQSKGFSLIMQIQCKQKQGFWASVFKGIVYLISTVVMAIVSAIVSVVAFVATPVVYCFGGSQAVNGMWKIVGGFWEQTGDLATKFLSRLPAIMTVGFGLLTIIFGAGALCPAICSFIAWLYCRNQVTIQKQNGSCQGVTKLIQITGFGNLNQESISKINTLRQKNKQLKARQQHKYSSIKNQLKQLINSERRTQQDIKKVQRQIFSNSDKHNEFNSSLDLSNQAKNKKLIAIQKIYQQQKIYQTVNKRVEVLNQQVKKELQTVNNTLNQSNKQLITQINKNITKQQNKLNSNENRTQQEVNQFYKNVQNSNKAAKQLAQIQSKRVQQQLDSQIKKLTLKLPETTKSNFLDEKLIQQYLQKPKNDIQKVIEKKQQRDQVIQIANSNLLRQNPLLVQVSTIKSKQFRSKVKAHQEKYVEFLTKSIQQHQKQDQKQIDKQEQEQAEKIMRKRYEQQQVLNKIIKNTPLQNVLMLNQHFYYKDIIQHKCLFEAVEFQEFNHIDHKQTVKVLATKLKKQQPSISILNKNTMLYSNNEKLKCKIYKEKSQQSQKFQKQLRKIEKDLQIQYATEKEIKNIGSSLMLETQMFLKNPDTFKFDQMKQPLSKLQAQKKYIETLIIKSVQIMIKDKQHDTIKQKRQVKEKSLPYAFFPFQYGIQSENFKTFGLSLSDFICSSILKGQSQWKEFQHLIESTRKDMVTHQIEIINNFYPQFQHLVKKEVTVTNRRRKQ